MNKILRIILILVVVGLISGLGVYMYVFHKPHRNIEKENPTYTVSAADLLTQFSLMEDSSNNKYGNKVLLVSGKIVDITKKEDLIITFVLENSSSGISCNFDSAYSTEKSDVLNKFKIDESIHLKGKCDGYDVITGVVLTDCVLIDNE
jgi:hypothetical protein